MSGSVAPQASSAPQTIASGQTNERPNSIVPAQARTPCTVRYIFVPVKLGPHVGEAAGQPQDSWAKLSSSLSGAPVHVAGTTLQPLPDGPHRKLGKPETVEVRDANGQEIRIKGSVLAINGVHTGDSVHLHLARDACRGRRKKPLWRIDSIDCDTDIVIFERPGHGGDLTGVEHTYSNYISRPRKRFYSAFLTGRTWRECNPSFTGAEIEAFATRDGYPLAITSALKRIYAGHIQRTPTSAVLTIDYVPPRGSWLSNVAWSADDPQLQTRLELYWDLKSDDNAEYNVSGFTPDDVITPVHPRCYAAIIAAAMEAGASRMKIASGWRPMLGSCGHRLGLGLDVSRITPFGGAEERIEFYSLSSAQAGNLAAAKAAKQAATEATAAHTAAKRARDSAAAKYKSPIAAADKAAEIADRASRESVTRQAALAAADERIAALAGMASDAARVEEANLRARRRQLQKKAQEADQAAALAQKSFNKIDKQAADQRARKAKAEAVVEEAKEAEAEALAARDAAAKAWLTSGAGSERSIVTRFRAALARNPGVRQIIDPWQIDYSVGGAPSATPNLQTSDEERAHLNHLHVTCHDPELPA